MLELATLGALMGGPQHGYALKAWLERYMGSQLTVNYGAIYPLLRRLREQGLIESREERDDQRRKQATYFVTGEGKKRFRAEMLSFPNESRVNARTRFLTKAYFFAHVTSNQRADIMQRRLDALADSSEQAATMEWPAEHYRRHVFEFAVDQIEREAIWVAEMLMREKASK
jgi:DNA-binding PadR family transcriptional regulator